VFIIFYWGVQFNKNHKSTVGIEYLDVSKTYLDKSNVGELESAQKN